jgi:hypothetical protein
MQCRKRPSRHMPLINHTDLICSFEDRLIIQLDGDCDLYRIARCHSLKIFSSKVRDRRIARDIGINGMRPLTDK